MLKKRDLFILIWIGLIFSSQSIALSLGKISGRIIDDETGQTLPYANIEIMDKALGTVTDANGRFYFLNLSPKKYNLRITMMGYQEMIIVDVEVYSNLSTFQVIPMQSKIIEQDTVLIIAAQELVEKRLTSTKTYYSKEEIDDREFHSVEELVNISAGAFRGFVRGGKQFETRYLLDGIDISDIYYQGGTGGYGIEPTGESYQGFRRSNAEENNFTTVSPFILSELNMYLGTVNAEYGSTGSGVISMISQDPGSTISGNGYFKTSWADYLNHSGNDIYIQNIRRDGVCVNDADDYLNLKHYYDSLAQLEDQTLPASMQPNTIKSRFFTWYPGKYPYGSANPNGHSHQIGFNINGPLTKKMSFVFQSESYQRLGPLPLEADKRLTSCLKLIWQPSPDIKLSNIGILEDGGKLFKSYINTRFNLRFKFFLEGSPKYKSLGLTDIFRFTHTLSPNTFYELSFFYLSKLNEMGYADDNNDGQCDINENGEFIKFNDKETYFKYVGNPKDMNYWWRSNNFNHGFMDTTYNQTAFFIMELDAAQTWNLFPIGQFPSYYRVIWSSPAYEYNSRETLGLKAEITHQVNFNHQLKSGLQFKYHEIDKDYKASRRGGKGLEYPTSFFYVDKYLFNPVELSAFVQDQMEFDRLIMNIGCRLDGFYSDMRKYINEFAPFTTVLDSITHELIRYEPLRGAKEPMKFYFSPRIGVSHPISDQFAMHFSYASIYQQLPFAALYDDYNFTNYNSSPTMTAKRVGQPPIRSTAYEIGAQIAFSNSLLVDATAYYRDIRNYDIAFFRVTNVENYGVEYYTSFGYADSRGIEFSLSKSFSSLVALRFNYTYSYIKTSVSSPGSDEDQRISFNAAIDSIQYGTRLPWENLEHINTYEEHILGNYSSNSIGSGFDRPHRFNLDMIARLPWRFSFIQLMNINLLSMAYSGFYYQKNLNSENELWFERNRKIEQGPWFYRTDLKITLGLNFMKIHQMQFFIDIRNLFNRENVLAISKRFSMSSEDHAIWESSIDDPTQSNYNPQGVLTMPVDDYGNMLYDIAREMYIGLKFEF